MANEILFKITVSGFGGLGSFGFAVVVFVVGFGF
jgi:hypothetical protein